MRTGDRFDNTPRVEGVHLHMFVGGSFDAQRVGRMVGTYQAGMGCATHHVFDIPVAKLKPVVQKSIPDSIASNRDGSIIRIYVPISKNGQVGEIGLMNGVYKAPAHPFVPRDGGPIYCAPNDAAKYLARGETRQKGSLINPWSDNDTWQPGPGDRFRVTEHT